MVPRADAWRHLFKLLYPRPSVRQPHSAALDAHYPDQQDVPNQLLKPPKLTDLGRYNPEHPSAPRSRRLQPRAPSVKGAFAFFDLFDSPL